MKKIKLKLIERHFRGQGNKYQFGETVFITHRSESFCVYDQSIGLYAGQEVFRIYGRWDFNYGMRKFKEWLETSKYNTTETTKKLHCQCLYESENNLPRTQFCFVSCLDQIEILAERDKSAKAKINDNEKNS